MQTGCSAPTQPKLASDLEGPALSGSSMLGCRSFLPASLAGAEGLASSPWSVRSPDLCEEHGESLSLFCLDDLEPSCKQCAAVSHAGHRVYLLTEAATDCKGELTTSLNGLKKRISVFEKVTQTCEHSSRHNQAEARLTEEHMKRDFESLHQFLREEEAARLLALREKREQKKREAEEGADRMNRVIKTLEEHIRLIEEEIDAGGDGVGFLERYNDTTERFRESQDTRRPLINVAEHLGNLQYEVWKKMKCLAPYTPVTLDPRTAGQSLRVSPGLIWAYTTPEAMGPAPANPERFHPNSCILAREGFDSGTHSWDIEVGDSSNWTVGAAAQSVSRKTEFEVCPAAGLWCISLRDGEYRALTTPSQGLNLDNSNHLSRISVRLDWDEGTLEFMNTDTETHLFTFRYRFTEKVYPFFESVSSCGGFAVLAQGVNVSVDSDYVSVEGIKEDQMQKNKSCAEGDADTASDYSENKMSEGESLTENKKSAICPIREEKKNKPQRRATKDQLITTKPTGKEKAKDNRSAVKKQNNKHRFSVTYHVSLNRALKISNHESGHHKQIQTT